MAQEVPGVAPCIDLRGRVAIVTGGSQGIGRGIALTLARAGADLVIASRTQARIEEACQEVLTTGRRALGVQTDVTKEDDVARLVDRTVDSFGRLDILVNNAGGSYGRTFRRGPLIGLTGSDFDECLALNLKSVFLCSTAAAPVMMRQGRGAIVNISSIANRESEATWGGFSLYAAAKAGVVTLTWSMAAEWAPRVRVNCVTPGFVSSRRVSASRSTERVKARLSTVSLGRPGEPEEIGNAVAFLASDAASYVTGTVMDVHGGLKSNLPPVDMPLQV